MLAPMSLPEPTAYPKTQISSALQTRPGFAFTSLRTGLKMNLWWFIEKGINKRLFCF